PKLLSLVDEATDRSEEATQGAGSWDAGVPLPGEPQGLGLCPPLPRRSGARRRQSLPPCAVRRAGPGIVQGHGARRAVRPDGVPCHRRASVFCHPGSLWLLLVCAETPACWVDRPRG